MTVIQPETVLTDANLYAAWSQVKENQGCAGVDGQTIADFELELSANLAKLKKEVIAGTYRPLPRLRAWMPKKGGGRRPLAIPTVNSYCTSYCIVLES